MQFNKLINKISKSRDKFNNLQLNFWTRSFSPSGFYYWNWHNRLCLWICLCLYVQVCVCMCIYVCLAVLVSVFVWVCVKERRLVYYLFVIDWFILLYCFLLYIKSWNCIFFSVMLKFTIAEYVKFPLGITSLLQCVYCWYNPTFCKCLFALKLTTLFLNISLRNKWKKTTNKMHFLASNILAKRLLSGSVDFARQRNHNHVSNVRRYFYVRFSFCMLLIIA